MQTGLVVHMTSHPAGTVPRDITATWDEHGRLSSVDKVRMTRLFGDVHVYSTSAPSDALDRAFRPLRDAATATGIDRVVIGDDYIHYGRIGTPVDQLTRVLEPGAKQLPQIGEVLLGYGDAKLGVKQAMRGDLPAVSVRAGIDAVRNLLRVR